MSSKNENTVSSRSKPSNEVSSSRSKPSNEVSSSRSKPSNEIFIGKKPLMTYVTATLVQLANEPSVVIKARGKSIPRAVDVAQIIVKRMETLGYKVASVKLGSEAVQSQDGNTRNVSTIEVAVSRNST